MSTEHEILAAMDSLVEAAKRGAETNLRESGKVMPVAVIAVRRGALPDPNIDRIVVPFPPVRCDDDKERFARNLGAMIRRLNAVAVAIIYEAWHTDLRNGTRREVVLIATESRLTHRQSMAPIVTVAETGKRAIGAWEDTAMDAGGRFAGFFDHQQAARS